MINPDWKQLFNWAGFGVGILGVAFVVNKLQMFSGQVDFSTFSGQSLYAVGGLILAYCGSNLFLTFAWRDILGYLGVGINKRWAIQTYGISQIAKYVPGNIFHLAGRQAIGQAANIPATPLAKSAIWEIGLIAFTGVCFSCLVIPLYLPLVTFPMSEGVFVLVLCISLIVLYYWVGAKVAAAMKWYLLFLTCSGLVFCFVLMVVTPFKLEINSLTTGITGVYVVAWLAGLLTPGAPAGIGVREVVFLSLLHSVIPDGELLKAIILGRFVTVGGDVLFYIFAIVFRYTSKRNRTVFNTMLNHKYRFYQNGLIIFRKKTNRKC